MLSERQQRDFLDRIEEALGAASVLATQFTVDTCEVDDHGGRNVVTEVDRRVSDLLRAKLLRPGEGWLSEEDPDDRARLSCNVVWVVDPLDGTREFVDGIPEWCISVGLVEHGVAIAGGTSNPSTGEIFLGARDCGVTYNSNPVKVSERSTLQAARILASRSECNRGEWRCFEGAGFTVQPMGSVAYKLSLVAAGLADATWTLTPKHEWDVAAGVALVKAAGGWVARPDDRQLRFNQDKPLLPGLLAASSRLAPEVANLTQHRRAIE